MHWGGWYDFWAMGGYSFYVWGSYAVTAVVMALELVLLRRRKRIALDSARRMQIARNGDMR